MPSRQRLTRFLLRGTLAAAIAGAVIAATLGSYTWWERTGDFDLPVPSGPLPVGRTIEDWVDPDHTDSVAPTRDSHRELLAWIWYPSSRTGSSDFLPVQMRRGWTQQGPLGWLTH